MDQALIDKYSDEWKQIGEYRSPWGPDAREPMRNYVITERENFERLFRHEKPAYIPNITEMTAFSPTRPALTIPMVNSTTTIVPKAPVAANIGSSSSPMTGSVMPRLPASRTSNTPNAINNRLTGTKANP